MWTVASFLLALPAVAIGAGYCSTNTFPTNSSWLQFTKEPIPVEYATDNSFKSIHCCGKGYRSIEWFKNGVAYPWSANVSNLILYPEAANQTLYTRGASSVDSGNYTCRMSNETHEQHHTVHLEVIDQAPEAPKTMFISADQWVEEGTHVRLFCEALVGPSYLADAKTELRWSKVWSNGTEGALLPSHREILTTREDNKNILGSYLIISETSSTDYGTYVCAILSNEIISKRYVTIHYRAGDDVEYNGAGSECPWNTILVVAACATAVVVTLAVLHRKFTPRLLLSMRLMHARATQATQRTSILEKDFDVAVSYTTVDSELVHGVLLNTLELKYNYRVMPVLLSSPENWYRELSPELHRCRSLVCVVSPAQYSPSQLLLALKQMRALSLTPVVVLLQDLPKVKWEAKDERGERLVTLVRHTRLVPWRHVHDRAFWTALRLALPLPPLVQAKVTMSESRNKNSCTGNEDALV